MPLPAFLASRLRSLRRPRVWAYVLGGGVVLHAVVGFLVVPWVLRREVPKRLNALLGREVRLGKVAFNPYTFRLQAQDFAVMEPQGPVLMGFDRLEVDARGTSLFRQEVVLDQVVLQGFQGRYQLLPGGRTNLSDILARFASGPAAPAARGTQAPGEPSNPRGLHIRSFRLDGARASFEDLSTQHPFRVDLGPYSLDLADFRTLPGTRSTHRFVLKGATGESLLWSGTFSLEPFQSEGAILLEGVPLARYAPYTDPHVGFRIRQGTGRLACAYRFAWSPSAQRLELHGGSLRLRDLELAPQTGGSTEVRLSALRLEDITYDVFRGRLRIAETVFEPGQWTLVRDGAGALSLPRLFLGPPAVAPAIVPAQAVHVPAAPDPRPTAPRPTPPPPEPFALHLDRIRLQAQRVAFLDQSTPTPVRTVLTLSQMEAGPFTLDSKGITVLSAAASLDTGGRLEVTGTVQPLRPGFRLQATLRDLNLPPLQPYAADTLKASLTSGALQARLTLEGTFDGASQLTARGDLSLRDAALREAPMGGPLLTLPGVSMQGVAFTLEPFSLRLRNLELDRPSAELRLQPEGLNLALALGQAPAPPAVEASAAEAPEATEATPVVPPTAPVAPPPTIHLESLQLRGGRVRFTDTTLQPAAEVTLAELEVAGQAFSTVPGAPSRLKVSTRLDGVAPLDLQGRFNLLDPLADSDLSVQTRGWDLAPSAPYVAKYLGYAFRKGKLDLDVDWKVRQRRLEAENRARLDQFFLGDRIPGPDAVRAPVKLGLALLRDRHGVIEADIPVQGTLDAPDFKLRKVIWKAIGNLFTKLATSPFDALARLVGSSQDLSQASFLPGTSELSPEGRERLQTLAKALAERPELRLEVSGTTDPAADEGALRRAALEAQLTRDHSGALPPEARLEALRQAWRAAHPLPKGTPEPPAEAMEAQLLADLPGIPAALSALPGRRAAQTQEWLTALGIDHARIYLVDEAPGAPLAGVRLKLK